MTTLFVKPADPAEVIRDPVTFRPMPPEGAEVPADTIWLRRLGREEVVKTTAEAIAKGKAERERAEAAKSAAAPHAEATDVATPAKTTK